MITSGLVLTLNAEAALAEQAVASLRTRPEFTVGERNDRWLPVALEAADDAASRAAHDWLNSLPGVDFVDVVAVNFEGEENETPPDFGLRRQSGSGDGAFGRVGADQAGETERSFESGVAFHFPPQSKPLACQPTEDSSASPAKLAGVSQTQEVTYEH